MSLAIALQSTPFFEKQLNFELCHSEAADIPAVRVIILKVAGNRAVSILKMNCLMQGRSWYVAGSTDLSRPRSLGNRSKVEKVVYRNRETYDVCLKGFFERDNDSY